MERRPAILPEYVTPGAIADHFGVGERWIRDKAKEIGACCIFGNKMIHLPHHVETLLEALQPCPSNSTSAAKSGITEGLFPGGDYADLQKRLTAKQRKGSKLKSNKGHGSVVSMDRARG